MQHDICVFAGRFRPFHKGHLHVVTEALNVGQYLFIIVGSCGSPVTPRNPFSFEEVREMIRGSLHPRDADRVFIFGVEDFDNDTKWVSRVQEIVATNVERLSLVGEPKIALIGCEKDHSSYYLKLFPQWANVGVPPYQDLDASNLRGDLFMNEDSAAEVERMKDTILPHGSFLLLREWVRSPQFEELRAEYAFMFHYLSQFSSDPYPQNFCTADAVVIQSGHVLLVRRGERPGKGLWALPGGHIRQTETFLQAAIRELCEETGLGRTFDPDMLTLLVKGEKLLDNPHRSTRFRTVSVAYLFNLTGARYLPPVQGEDDAELARWWPLNEVTRAMMFEDHFLVIQHFASQIDA